MPEVKNLQKYSFHLKYGSKCVDLAKLYLLIRLWRYIWNCCMYFITINRTLIALTEKMYLWYRRKHQSFHASCVLWSFQTQTISVLGLHSERQIWLRLHVFYKQANPLLANWTTVLSFTSLHENSKHSVCTMVYYNFFSEINKYVRLIINLNLNSFQVTVMV